MNTLSPPIETGTWPAFGAEERRERACEREIIFDWGSGSTVLPAAALPESQLLRKDAILHTVLWHRAVDVYGYLRYGACS